MKQYKKANRDKYRDIVIEYANQGWPIRKIAAAIDIPRATVARWVNEFRVAAPPKTEKDCHAATAQILALQRSNQALRAKIDELQKQLVEARVKAKAIDAIIAQLVKFGVL